MDEEEEDLVMADCLEWFTLTSILLFIDWLIPVEGNKTVDEVSGAADKSNTFTDSLFLDGLCKSFVRWIL